MLNKQRETNRHNAEVLRDIYACAIAYIKKSGIKDPYERELLETALELKGIEEEYLFRKVDF